MAHKTKRMSAIALLFIGCAAAPPPPPPPPAGSVLIENQSQFDLLELRIHRGLDYAQTSNLLSSAMAVDDAVVFYGTGTFWITVFRETFRGGPIVALTTSAPVELEAERGYQLIVFDQSFRLSNRAWITPGSTGHPSFGNPFPGGGNFDGGPGFDPPDTGFEDQGSQDAGQLPDQGFLGNKPDLSAPDLQLLDLGFSSADLGD